MTIKVAPETHRCQKFINFTVIHKTIKDSSYDILWYTKTLVCLGQQSARCALDSEALWSMYACVTVPSHHFFFDHNTSCLSHLTGYAIFSDLLCRFLQVHAWEKNQQQSCLVIICITVLCYSLICLRGDSSSTFPVGGLGCGLICC